MKTFFILLALVVVVCWLGGMMASLEPGCGPSEVDANPPPPLPKEIQSSSTITINKESYKSYSRRHPARRFVPKRAWRRSDRKWLVIGLKDGRTLATSEGEWWWYSRGGACIKVNRETAERWSNEWRAFYATL